MTIECQSLRAYCANRIKCDGDSFGLNQRTVGNSDRAIYFNRGNSCMAVSNGD